MNEFAKYTAMKDLGATTLQVHHEANRDGVDAIKMIRLLRQVFGLSFVQVKDVLAKANGHASLDEYHEKLATQISG